MVNLEGGEQAKNRLGVDSYWRDESIDPSQNSH